MKKIITFLIALSAFVALNAQNNKLNVLLVLTDDQGYGDLSCKGNPYLKTPHIDKLSQESYNFTNYHTATTCAPTRSGLMTGMYCNKAGVWHTIMGRSILDLKRETVAEVFQRNGYATAMFGKWHLGDEYPYRPQDRGFDYVLCHKGGGIGQGPDYWGNTYFDPTLFTKEGTIKTEGFCTDIFFDNAIKFMEESVENNKSFFCYLALNAAHSPFVAPDEYMERFKGVKGVPNAGFYGMIENIDDNMGKLEEFLIASGLEENTIVIFTTDNGSTFGANYDRQGNAIKGWNAGMSGKKAGVQEGGHRVPFFMRIPNGDSVKIDQLMGYIDVAPTLYDLCGLKSDRKIDGISVKSVIDDPKTRIDRYLLGDTQRKELMSKDNISVVMKGSLRLINRSELYDVASDTMQKKDIAAQHPEVVSDMLKVHDEYWDYISVENDVMHPLYFPAKIGESVVLNSHDLHKDPAWNQAQFKAGRKIGEDAFWYINVPESGEYTIELLRWAPEYGLKLNDAPKDVRAKGKLKIIGGEITIGDMHLTENLAVGENPQSVKFNNVKLTKGEFKLFSNYLLANNTKTGSFYLRATKNP